MSQNSLSILLLEGNEEHASRIVKHLKRAGGESLEVVARNDLAAGLVRLAVGGLDAVLVNPRLPDADDHCISQIVAKAPDLPVVAISSNTDPQFVAGTIRDGAQEFLSKTKLSGDLMLRAIHGAIERKQSQ